MIVIIFRTRIKPNAPLEKLAQVGERMYELAAAIPGFISYRNYAAEDGENLSLVEFESLETLAAWRDHPEHKIVQQQGRDEFFSEYHIQVFCF